MNSFYGWIMSKYLPYGRFKLLKNVDEFHVISTSKKKFYSMFCRS